MPPKTKSAHRPANIAYITLRVPPAHKRQYEKAAEQADITLSQWCRRALAAALKTSTT